MFKKRSAIFYLTALSLLLPTTLAAQAGQYLILSAQYGNQRNHLDVTNRLKELAHRNARFRVDYRTFGDPAPGQAKVLRIYARGPNGRERMFEYQDNSVIDGAQFRGWGSGQWGGPNDRWSGNWDGGDVGQFLILSAQYGNRRRHMDVTNRLKQMASSNQKYRVDYRTFGDPAPGEAKVLRIYARGPNGRERMFEYQDNSVIDGAQFRGWGSGQWGGPNDRWSGNWDVPR
jgi:hypothetical protein